ncbi:hypothetical protein HF086_002149 [Spodoptera exigua]|uniref:Uncharacterized protein n=1 Tax=Spodoptera exigua TaxID=7107 RepID=A0A922MLH2_SPOEX|nr:hypothetical protein HF086_002149 [Spodoptera exigua]
MNVCACVLLFTVFELFAKPKALGKVPKIHFREPRVGTFTEFIQQAIQIINTYDDTTFGDFIDILDEEVGNYHYRGCKFSELTKNHETRRVLQAKLNLISGLPVPQTRTNINAFADILRHERYNKKVKDFVDFINSLYGPETLDKFEKILNKLEYYSKPKVRRLESNLKQIVKDGLRTLIFDYYTNLHVNAKIALKEKIQTILNQIQTTPTSAFNINRISYVPSSTNNFNVSENVITFPVHEFMPAHVTSEPRAEDRESSNDLKEASSMKARAKKPEEVDLKQKEVDLHMGSEDVLDSSSNSIEYFQEKLRHVYTQRYETLVTEGFDEVHSDDETDTSERMMNLTKLIK